MITAYSVAFLWIVQSTFVNKIDRFNNVNVMIKYELNVLI